MNPIASFYLGAKHWQLFLLSVALTLVQVVALLSNATLLGNPAITKTICGALDMLFLLGWMWAAGTFLNSLLEGTPLERDVTPFSISLIAPFALVLLADAAGAQNSSSPPPWTLLLTVVTFACLFFDIGFVADVLRRVEKRQAGGFGGMAWNFFGVWFFVIGIWWIQPRINKLYAAALGKSAGRPAGL
ncbi:MAG: hypothetical protein WA209_15285 [Candidatus Acidiferrales bacterium]